MACFNEVTALELTGESVDGELQGNDRHEGQKRRQGQRKPRRQGIPRIEFLEKRQLLSGTAPVSPTPPPIWTPTNNNLFDAQNGPMANLGANTVGVYSAYVKSGGNTSQLAGSIPHD